MAARLFIVVDGLLAAIASHQISIVFTTPTLTFNSVDNANHFFKGKEKDLVSSIEHYIKDKISIF